MREDSTLMEAAAFTRAEIDGLREAVAVHDEVDLAARLPAMIGINYDVALLERCYWLSHRLWEEIDVQALAGLSVRLARHGRLGDSDAGALKDIRARAKQLRFAYAMLDTRQTYPPRLDRLTRLMGHAQDTARAGRRAPAAFRGALLRLTLNRRSVAALRRELLGFVAVDQARLRGRILAEVEAARRACASPAITDQAFHDLRKSVSRLVSFYDTLTVLAPSEAHRAVDRFLSTINGLMGSIHDGMAVRKVSDRRGYMTVARALPAEVTDRLLRLAAFYDGAR